jgi:hypothetical protein
MWYLYLVENIEIFTEDSHMKNKCLFKSSVSFFLKEVLVRLGMFCNDENVLFLDCV